MYILKFRTHDGDCTSIGTVPAALMMVDSKKDPDKDCTSSGLSHYCNAATGIPYG
mgnify:FL=1